MSNGPFSQAGQLGLGLGGQGREDTTILSLGTGGHLSSAREPLLGTCSVYVLSSQRDGRRGRPSIYETRTI